MDAPTRNKYDVIVVLGAALHTDGTPTARMRNRVKHGVALFRQGKADALLVTGGHGNRGITEAEAMRDLAVAAGVPARRIVVEPCSRSTFENAAYATRFMSERGWKTALVVSDRIHLTRALLAFRRAGVQATGSPAPGSMSGKIWRRLWFRIAYASREFLALLWYVVLILFKRSRR